MPRLENSAGPSHPRLLRMILFCLRRTLQPSATGTSSFRSDTSTSGRADSPTACMILCVRFTCFVRSAWRNSATGATLDTGGWLNLTRQGLTPCKMHQASLGAPTLLFSGRGFLRSAAKALLCYYSSFRNLKSSSLNPIFLFNSASIAFPRLCKNEIGVKA